MAFEVELRAVVGRQDPAGEVIALLKARITSSSLQDSPAGLATAMHLAAREITTLLAPGLTRSGELRRVA